MARVREPEQLCHNINVQQGKPRTVVGDLGHGFCVCANDGPGGRVDKVGATRACACLVGCLERAGWEGSGCSENREDQGRSVEDVAQHD